MSRLSTSAQRRGKVTTTHHGRNLNFQRDNHTQRTAGSTDAFFGQCTYQMFGQCTNQMFGQCTYQMFGHSVNIINCHMKSCSEATHKTEQRLVGAQAAA